VLHRELSAEHSPESIEEFERVRGFKPALVGLFRCIYE
jgi:hypothetical protein